MRTSAMRVGAAVVVGSDVLLLAVSAGTAQASSGQGTGGTAESLTADNRDW
jgi:hypothetical protein